MNNNQGHDPKIDIVAAATRILVSQGLSNLSYDLIAAEAGTSRQLIRQYYPDPQDLTMDLCNQISSWYDEVLGSELKHTPKAKQLDHLLDFYFGLPTKFARSKRDDDQVVDALLALSAKSNGIKEELFEHYEKMQVRLAKAIRNALPHIKPKQCDELGFQVVCLLYGHWKMVESLNFSKTYRQVSRHAVDRLLAAHSE